MENSYYIFNSRVIFTLSPLIILRFSTFLVDLENHISLRLFFTCPIPKLVFRLTNVLIS